MSPLENKKTFQKIKTDKKRVSYENNKKNVKNVFSHLWLKVHVNQKEGHYHHL